jgi:hypothetical protein
MREIRNLLPVSARYIFRPPVISCTGRDAQAFPTSSLEYLPGSARDLRQGKVFTSLPEVVA